MLIVHVCSLWYSACFVEPDGRNVFVQFYFDLLVMEYLFCLFCNANLEILCNSYKKLCIKLVSIKELYYDARPTKSLDVLCF